MWLPWILLFYFSYVFTNRQSLPCLCLLPLIQVGKPKSPEPEATLTYPFLDKMPETNQLHLPNFNSQGKDKEMLYFSPTCSSGPICSKILLHVNEDYFLYVDVPLAIVFAEPSGCITDFRTEFWAALSVAQPRTPAVKTILPVIGMIMPIQVFDALK